jgi:hypothetical protein
MISGNLGAVPLGHFPACAMGKGGQQIWRLRSGKDRLALFHRAVLPRCVFLVLLWGKISVNFRAAQVSALVS